MGLIPLILLAILAVPTLQEKIYSHGPEGILWHYDTCPMLAKLRGSVQECEVVCSLNDACTAFNFVAAGVDTRCELLECPIPIPKPNWKYGQGWLGYYQVSDINECDIDMGGCTQICQNTEGSFRCSCYAGYLLDNDGKSCSDINECDIDMGGCSQICQNTEGSFRCSCYAGYLLDNDGKSCSDINECAHNNGGCAQVCENTIGSYKCKCDPGYFINDYVSMTCIDIDECLNNNGGCGQQCANTKGSYYCSCHRGYSLGSNNMDCIDIDECLNNNGGCGQQCTNTKGAYYCSCRSGYSLGSNNMDCIDIDECLNNNGGCGQQCTNTKGAYYCSCHRGYSLGSNNMDCIDNDECLNNNGGCGQQCTNTKGSYYCSCYRGYSLGSNNMECIDRCPEAKGFVRVPTSGNQCIKVFNVKLSWDDTTALCQDEGLMLVKPIDPVAMRKFIVEKYGDKQIWLDGQGTGSSVVWHRDGTTLPSSSPYWFPGQPGWSITTRYCLLLLSFKQHLTNNPTTPYLMWPCTDTYWMHAACELVN